MKNMTTYRLLAVILQSIAAIFFVFLLGGVLIFFIFPENFFAGNQETLVTYCFVCGVCGLMFLLPSFSFRSADKTQLNNKNLKSIGNCREMIVVDLKLVQNDKLRAYVVCKDPKEPENSNLYKSDMQFLSYCATKCPIGSFVPVYFDPKNPEHYFVDVDCAYTDKEKLEIMNKGTNLKQTIESNRTITFKNYRHRKSQLFAGCMPCLLGLGFFYITIFAEADSIGALLLFAGLGILFTALGIYIIYQDIKQRKLSVLVKTGIKFQATLSGVHTRIETNNGITDKKTTLYFSGRNPITGNEENFQFFSSSGKIEENRIETGTVNIYVNPNKPSQTFMDISSCVLKLKG